MLTSLRRALRSLGRQVTVMVIPHADLPVLRGRFSLSFILFLLGGWTLLTVWAGFVGGRHVDYWITKADNMVMRAKMGYLAEEIDDSREMLEMARATDQQMRILLGMRTRDAIVRAEDGVGGPSVSDRAGLRALLSGDPARVPESRLRRELDRVREESERRLASFQEIAWYITNQRSLYFGTPSVWPTAGHITSSYGYRFSPFRGGDPHNENFHSGIDIANSPDTPIVATADGVVRYAGWQSGYGMMVLLDHGFGYSTLYGHTSKVTVAVGERIPRNRQIAYMGTTGRSTGHHLHYEVWRHGKPVNPLRYLRVQPEAPAPDR